MADNASEKRPTYSFPLYGFLHLSSSIFFDRPKRSFYVDANYLLNSHTPRPLLTGIENLPRDGAFLIVANHHHRAGLWIGWIGAMLVEAIYASRPVQFPLRIVVTDAQRFKFRGTARVFPISSWFLKRVAMLWGMIPIPGESDADNTTGRAAALKHVLSLLRNGEPVLFFPEGDRGTAYGLVEALPGTGSFIALAARRAPIIPVAFWEDGDQLRGHIAPPITLTSSDDAAVRQEVMVRIGRMLPPSMWGAYAEAIAAAKNTNIVS
ncbi:MAG: lysophospholipid acyltransferase family protein [Chloroflexota bacterium]